MRISSTVARVKIPSIEKGGGLIVDHDVIVPFGGVMRLFESEDGQLLIEGEGYICADAERARAVFRQTKKTGFVFDRECHFHRLEVSRLVRGDEAALAAAHGFVVYKDRWYDGGWVVLKAAQCAEGAPLWQQYRAGRILEGRLYLVGHKEPRVPEEAVGDCYCSMMWGEQPGSEYALVPA